MKRRTAQGIAVATAALLAVACMDTTSPTSGSALALSQAFMTLPAGFTLTNNSFAGDGTTGGAFMPRMNDGGRGRGGPGHGPFDDISGHGGGQGRKQKNTQQEEEEGGKQGHAKGRRPSGLLSVLQAYRSLRLLIRADLGKQFLLAAWNGYLRFLRVRSSTSRSTAECYLATGFCCPRPPGRGQSGPVYQDAPDLGALPLRWAGNHRTAHHGSQRAMTRRPNRSRWPRRPRSGARSKAIS